MAHSKSLYSFRMAQKAEMIALCALINSVYRGDAAKDGWTTEADLLGGQRCDVAMLENSPTNRTVVSWWPRKKTRSSPAVMYNLPQRRSPSAECFP